MNALRAPLTAPGCSLNASRYLSHKGEARKPRPRCNAYRLIVQAAANAQKAVDLILGTAFESEAEQEREEAATSGLPDRSRKVWQRKGTGERGKA
jgi:hypothetical protein